VVGYSEAVDLLSDARLHADTVGMFEDVGITTGPAWEIAKHSLLSLNGEEHKRVRALVAGYFTPRAVERLRPFSRVIATDLLAKLSPRGGFDVIGDFATPYVRATTCRYIGFPESAVAACSDAVDLIGWAMKDLANRHADVERGLVELVEQARSFLDERRRAATDDVLSVLAQAEARGEIPEAAALSIIATLLSAGQEPTVNQVGIMVQVLGAHPNVWDAVGTGELGPAGAVEAVLRFRSSNQGMLRRVAESFEYQGSQFNESGTILIRTASANHDPRRFREPDRLAVAKQNVSHLAFGFGPHYCLGRSHGSSFKRRFAR
jgi:cytochrome P450